ncbi:hypothetical protein [Mycobacterium persicum]|uniref:hypothetical protein n=1 Tax=Mycobacterium persicum TaxID=1487726 RepID=UPI0009F29466|nr:hypothetical protein [Mycobacterium persicum]ORB51421.1 hypothetical protein BST40_10440 [Mycobacterium persicum]
MTTPTRTTAFLSDYCPRCNPAGHYADSGTRMASLADPVSVSWPGGRFAICRYRCRRRRCGHRWVRRDLWTAREAGFDTKRGKMAA